jgi:hypothetical protein
MLGKWAANLQVCNVTNVQNGQYTCARIIAEKTREAIVRDYRNGGFLDALFPPDTREVAEPATQNSCRAGVSCPGAGMCVGSINCQKQSVGELLSHTETGYRGDFYNEMAVHYGKYIEYIRQIRPDAVAVANTGDNRTRYLGAGWVYEVGASTMGATEPVTYWDPHSVANGNTKCAHMLAAVSDLYSEYTAPDGWFYWDRGQRSPMVALAIFYTYANECIDMFYNISPVTWYSGSDDYQYWNETADGSVTAAVSVNTGAAVKTLTGNFTAFPTGSSLMRIGSAGETLKITKVSNTAVTTTEAVSNSYPAGTPVWLLRTAYLSSGTALPPPHRIYRWNAFFPAMETDIGVPDTVNGIAGDIKGVPKPKGFRFNNWITAPTSGTKNGITRRDFTKAIVVYARADYADWTGGSYAANHGPLTKAMATTYSKPFGITQNGQPLTLYPLRVDGVTDNSVCNYGPGSDFRTTGGGCTQFRLRTGEALILMKQRIQ